MSAQAHPDAVEVGGALYLRDAKTNLVPIEMVKPIDWLMDEMVWEIIEEAEQVSALIATFRASTFDKVAAFQKLLAQEHGAFIGGKKGNITLSSFNGCRKIQIAVADRTEFGPELLAAQALIEGCLTEWSSTSGAEICAIVNRAFPVEKEGQINRSALLMLLRVNILLSPAGAGWPVARDLHRYRVDLTRWPMIAGASCAPRAGGRSRWRTRWWRSGSRPGRRAGRCAGRSPAAVA